MEYLATPPGFQMALEKSEDLERGFCNNIDKHLKDYNLILATV